MTNTITFGKLPEKFHIGYEPVTPLSPLCSKLTPCITCKRVTTDFMKCAKAHATCGDCSLWQPSPDDPNEELVIKCADCCANVPAVRVVISDWFLQILEFSCGRCSFKGTLDKIKSHLGSPRNECRPVRPALKFTSAEAIDDMPSFRDKVKELEENVCNYEKYIKELEYELEKVEKMAAACRTYPAKLLTVLSTRGMIFFECTVDHATGRYEVLVPQNDVFHIRCLALHVRPLEKIYENNERWLSMEIAPASIQENIHRDLNISVKVHDRHGGIVTERHIETYDVANKKYIHPCFERFDGRYYEFAKLIRLADFKEKQIIIDDNLCISIDLWPQTDVERMKPAPRKGSRA